jgi:uncharacterized protein YdeI (YjbR/CyaY-like superfamily)
MEVFPIGRHLQYLKPKKFIISNMKITLKDVKTFAGVGAFEKWLEKNHAKSAGIWIRFFKKASKKKGITYDEALDVALCYGWIDSLVNKYDADSYIQKFSPRGPKSVWSKRNRGHVARLIKAKKMRPAGLAQVQAAKRDGRWDGAYDSPANMKIPADFLKKLKANKKASEFFKKLNCANLYAIAWRLQTAKRSETRERRMAAILAQLKAQKKFH